MSKKNLNAADAFESIDENDLASVGGGFDLAGLAKDPTVQEMAKKFFEVAKGLMSKSGGSGGGIGDLLGGLGGKGGLDKILGGLLNK